MKCFTYFLAFWFTLVACGCASHRTMRCDESASVTGTEEPSCPCSEAKPTPIKDAVLTGLGGVTGVVMIVPFIVVALPCVYACVLAEKLNSHH